jgi:hypothetical protein
VDLKKLHPDSRKLVKKRKDIRHPPRVVLVKMEFHGAKTIFVDDKIFDLIKVL